MRSSPKVSSESPTVVPLRRDITVVRSKSQESSEQYDELLNYEPSYRLLEEARKSWNYFVSDKFVYSVDSLKVALNSKMGIAKDYLSGRVWIELHMTFHLGLETEGNTHYAAILEACDLKNALRPREVNGRAVHRNPHVLVDDTHFVETPEEMAFHGIPSYIRLKRFDDSQCLCGHACRPFFKRPIVTLAENRKLGLSRIHPSQGGETPNQLVKRGSEILEDIGSNEGNSVGSFLEPTVDSEALIFKVVLRDEVKWFRFIEGTQFLPQSFKVFFRPSGFQVGVSKSDET